MSQSTQASSYDIEFRDVWKHFPGVEQPTLAGLNLAVKSGTIHTLLGHSGSGKSVTIKHILGLMAPNKGEVLVKGESVIDRSDQDMRRIRMNFGMLFQNSALFDSLSVFDNVAFPLREHRPDWDEDAIEKRVDELLALVELTGTHDRMPSDISGGMQKRVGLARAMALDPKILLFDEPTTGLDPMTATVIDELIVRTTRHIGGSAFIISHDIHAALRMSDFVSMLWKGKIVETAPPNEFKRSRNEVVSQFLKSAGVSQ